VKEKKTKLQQTAELGEEREGFNILVKSSNLYNSIQMAFSADHLSTLDEVFECCHCVKLTPCLNFVNLAEY